MNRVFILGAGFSKAIHHDMPLLADLSRRVKDTLSTKGVDIGPDLDALGNPEHWLSLLAERAPWLSSSEQMRNSALFIDVSRAIYEVLSAMQVRASIETPPTWLFPLVKYWHRTQSTVITFNYDCLVELAYMDAVLPELEPGGGQASALLVIPVTPAALRTASIIGGTKPETFKLLKLHGSLDWWYSGPQAEPSDPIYRMAWVGDFRRGILEVWIGAGGSELVADKVPMLIPPAATKTPFYENRLLAAQWIHAGEALRQAEELILMGYSAPLTDLTVTTLIATQFKGDAIVPVNRDPAVVDRVKELRGKIRPPEVIDSFVDASAIDKWVKTFASDPDTD